MRIAFVSAAWRRYDVTRLALAQRAHLCGELAERGHEATCVIVADDENLDIASELGFETVEQSNDELGRKFNDGLEYAARQLEADIFVLIGSDDWMHVDLFDRLPRAVWEPDLEASEEVAMVWSSGPEVATGSEIAVVDLGTGRLRRCRSRGRYGVIPWIFPRAALEPSGFRPIRDAINIGIDGALVAGLRCRPEWVFVDPHDLCRVDFKSAVNLNSYDKISAAIGYGAEEHSPWDSLAEHYPEELVAQAAIHSGAVRVSGALSV